ncbi:DEAD/DEAH box helicase [Streptomyces sp. L7]
MLANLAQLGYTDMTPIQAASLPIALAGHDLIAQAKTGSRQDHAAFALALLARLDARNFDVQAMVLCPTRELADQVAQGDPPPWPAPKKRKGAHALRRHADAPAGSLASSMAHMSSSARRAASWTIWSAAISRSAH